MNHCKTSALDRIIFTRGVKNGLNAFIADKLEDSKTTICRNEYYEVHGNIATT
jgi:hypothetical protein